MVHNLLFCKEIFMGIKVQYLKILSRIYFIKWEENYTTIVKIPDWKLTISNKEPGIYSARYMGEDTSYRIKNTSLIERLTGVPDEKRTARFVCAIAAAFPDGTIKTTEGVIEGRIGYEERGENGFGYDPIFYVPEFGCTTAELSEEQKNAVSHRGKALEKMREILKESVNAE